MALTGRFTFRRSFGGRIILQVEDETRTVWPFSRRTPFKKRWRDATLMDLAAPELRTLIDLRYKPQFMAQYDYRAAESPHQAVAPEREEASAPPPDTRLFGRRGSGQGPAVAVEVERDEAFPSRSRQGDAA